MSNDENNWNKSEGAFQCVNNEFYEMTNYSKKKL